MMGRLSLHGVLWLLFGVFYCEVAFSQGGGNTTVEFPDGTLASYAIVSSTRDVPFTLWDIVNADEPKSRRIVGKVAFPSDMAIRVHITTAEPLEVLDALARVRLFGGEKVTELELDGEGTPTVLADLRFHKRLRFLEVRGCKDLDTPAGRAAIAELTTLEYLAVSPFGETSSNEFAKCLTLLPKLKCVRLCAENLGEEVIQTLCKVKGLETVEFFGNRSRISARALKHFGSLAKLSQLSVVCDAEIQMSDLESLARHPPMRHLRVLSNSKHFEVQEAEQHLNTIASACRTSVTRFILPRPDETPAPVE